MDTLADTTPIVSVLADTRARAAQLMSDYECTGTDECLCLVCMAANDAILDAQDAFARLMDESGLCQLARDHRAFQRNIRLDRVMARWVMFTALQSERAYPIKNFARSWAWGTGRKTLTAPDDAFLTDSPARVTNVY